MIVHSYTVLYTIAVENVGQQRTVPQYSVIGKYSLREAVPYSVEPCAHACPETGV